MGKRKNLLSFYRNPGGFCNTCILSYPNKKAQAKPGILEILSYRRPAVVLCLEF